MTQVLAEHQAPHPLHMVLNAHPIGKLAVGLHRQLWPLAGPFLAARDGNSQNWGRGGVMNLACTGRKKWAGWDSNPGHPD